MRHYCTLFDQAYLTKGLVLYESLLKHSSEPFSLNILAMDDATFRILCELQLKHAVICPTSPFEELENLQAIKAGRTYQEYCWTLASVFLNWEMHLAGSECWAYLDADLCFFSDPKVIFDEIGQRSIGITPHRFNETERLRLGENGKFNVGVVVARKTETGRKCIARWAAQCRERCSALEGCGDQKYLDEFIPTFGDEVCAIQSLGVNLGPWSIGNFAITQRDGRVFVNEDALVCYHAHEFRDENFLTGWPLRPEDVELIYKPYVQEWLAAKERIAGVEAEMEWERA